MLRILIVDDEVPARARLRRMLADLPAVHVVGEAASAQEALRLIPLQSPDAVLLDISMPGMDGMALARTLREQPSAPVVIFCTAWSDRAVDAFECEAVDYLVKPVRAERLAAAVDKARRHLSLEDAAIDGPLLRCTVGGRTRLLPLADVIYLAAEDKYTTVVHENGSSVSSQSLKELERQHGDLLVRVHRGALVVKKRIRGLETANGGHLLQLDGTDARVQVSRRKLPELRKLIRELT